MPEATAQRKTPLFSVVLIAILIALPAAILAQGGGGQGRGRGAGGGAGAGAPAGAPAVPGAPAPGGPGAAQAGGRGGGFGAPQTGGGAGARGQAPVDLTGYWVSLVTEDWIERMSPDSPRSGAVGAQGNGGGGGGRGGGGAPGGGAAAAPPAGEKCRAYAAGGSMRVPGRLNISWDDDNTLKVEMDSGTQTRLLHFNAPAPAGTAKSLQGWSNASWETGARGGGGRGGGGGAPAGPRWGSLNVTTSYLSSGYLLSSRSAYSENATLTEYFSKHSDFGQDYLTVTATVVDGNNTRTVSSTFKKEPNGSKFKPSGCEVVR